MNEAGSVGLNCSSWRRGTVGPFEALKGHHSWVIQPRTARKDVRWFNAAACETGLNFSE